MKYILFIFAVYFLALSIMPCTDVQNTDPLFSSFQTEQLQENHNHAHAQDLCGPFCLCDCCGVIPGFVFQFRTYSFSIPETEELKQIITYNNPHIVSGFYGNIWQPPQINS